MTASPSPPTSPPAADMPPTARLLAVSVGAAAPLFVGDGGRAEAVLSGIRKSPVSTAADPREVEVRGLGVAGDTQVDTSVHGGVDKAVYLYPAEHAAFWIEQRRRALGLDDPLPPGFVGENLTVEGLLEDAVHVGDTLAIGTVRLVVTAPREPCFKFNARMGWKGAAKAMVQSGRSGWYASVLEPGRLRAGDPIRVIPGSRQVSIAQLNAFRQRASGQRGLF